MNLIGFTLAILIFMAVALLGALAAGDMRLRRFYERRQWFSRRAEEASKLVAQLREDFHLELPEEEEEDEKTKIRIEDEMDEETQAHIELLELINKAAKENIKEFSGAVKQLIATDVQHRNRLSVLDIEEAEGDLRSTRSGQTPSAVA